MLLKPENKATLTGILTYHVIAGKLDSKELAQVTIRDVNQSNGVIHVTDHVVMHK